MRLGLLDGAALRRYVPVSRSKMLLAVAVLAYFGFVLPSSAVEYTITDLGTLPGSSYSLGQGINNSGQVTGYSQFSSTSSAIVWNGSASTVLGIPSGGATRGFGINNSGQVTGDSIGADGQSHATVWNGTTPSVLNTLPGGSFSQGLAINNSGQVAGNSNSAAGPPLQATIWNGTTPTALGLLLGSAYSAAEGINKSGQVVGFNYFSNGPTATISAPLPLLSGSCQVLSTP